MKSRTIALAALLVSSAALAQTNVYRWTDKDGKVHFSDAPPAADAKDVTQKQLGGGSVDESQLPYATQMAVRRNPVTLFTSNGCGEVCVQGRALLANRGIPFAERNAEVNPADAEALKQLIGELQVPVLLVGQTPMKGYDEGSWQAALDTAGYPRTRLPGQPPGRGTSSAAPKEAAEAGGPK